MTLEDYIEKHTSCENPLLRSIFRETNLKVLNSRMLCGHVQGRFLALISRLVKPRRVLEIGTFTGYSALCLCEGLIPDGKLITIEIDDELEDIILKNFRGSSYHHKIQLIIGNAIEFIPKIPDNFDLVYIDGHKPEYTKYLELIKPKLNRGAVVIADNVLWDGKVLDSDEADPSTEELRKFNQRVHDDPDFENVLLPLRDGLMIFQFLPQ